jgi:hypothetical protein
MQQQHGFKNSLGLPTSEGPTNDLHSVWSAFIAFCSELEHGEIETLKIQNGLPVLAEITRKKIKFAP